MAAAVCLAGAAGAGVVFDTISNAAFPPTNVTISTRWHAEDVTITGDAGQPLRSVELLTRLSFASSFAQFTGILAIAVMPSQTGVPGARTPARPAQTV